MRLLSAKVASVVDEPRMATNSNAKWPASRARISPGGEYWVAIYAQSASETTSHSASHVSTQIAEIEGLCEQRHWIVPDCYVDRVTSDMSTVHKGLHRLLRDAEARPRPFDAVLVREPSCISRALVVLVVLIEHLKACGVEVRTPNQSLDRRTFDDGSGPLALRLTPTICRVAK